MPVSDYEDEPEHPCDEDDPSLQKHGFLSAMDPPLVAATRVSDQLSQPASSLVIQAMAMPSYNEDVVHVAAVVDELDATMASSLATSSLSSGPQAGLHPQQHANTTRIEAVQIDELAPSQERSLEFTEPQEDGYEKDKFCRRHWKVSLLVLFCLVVGGATGMILAIQTRINTDGEGSSSLVVTPTLRPSLAPTNAPTTTFAPSFSPSCVGDWTLTWFDNTLGYYEYERFHVSPDGMSAILTYTEDRFFGGEAFFLRTLDFSEFGILTTTARFPKLEISDAVLSMDGSRLILGVSDDVYAAEEVGGALWVYQRVEMAVWIPLHYHFTSGGSQGVVFSVATSNTGKINAIVAGSFSDNIPVYVQVYSSFRENAEDLTTMGDLLVEGAFSNTTLVGLSGNGLRLFVYTDNGIIRILDYDDVATKWHPSGQPLNISASDSGLVSKLKVAESGKAFALFSSEPRSDSYLFHWNRSAWVTTVVPGLQERNVTLQYCDFSSDGTTLVIATSGNATGSRKVRLYEQVNGAWAVTHVLELPDTFGSLLGVSVDADGARIVVAGDQSIHVYDRVCRSMATLSPAPTSYREFNSYAPTSPIVSSPVALVGAPDGTDVALKPTYGSSVCEFEPINNMTQSFSGNTNTTLLGSQFDNATIRDEGILSAAGSLGANSTEIQSFSTGKLLSGDGSIMIVIGYNGETGDYFMDTYHLRNSSAKTGRITVPYVITSAAVSEQGERLVFGTSDTSTMQNGGFFFIYRRKGLEWVLEITEVVQRSGFGGVVSVTITDDGNSMAYAASFGNQTGFVSAYRFKGGSFEIVGDILSDHWVDEFTVVRLVDERLFVASSDGFIRTYDLISNTWERIGQLVPHFYEAMFVPSKNNTILAIASRNFGVVIYDLMGAYWIPVMQNMMDPLYVDSSFTTVDFSISSDGNVTALTKMLNQPESVASLDQQYVLTLFDRSNGNYLPTQDINLNVTKIDGDAVLAQLTSSGDLVLAMGTNVTEYRRAMSC
ncbi:hypothetical protein MHU86_23539 [Fragilaria crotonensis]|nr:hypothetical protein MHU86_23539 [Fragilaria crotonensis]